MLSRTRKHPCLIIATLAPQFENYAAFDSRLILKLNLNRKFLCCKTSDWVSSEQYHSPPIQMTPSVILYWPAGSDQFVNGFKFTCLKYRRVDWKIYVDYPSRLTRKTHPELRAFSIGPHLFLMPPKSILSDSNLSRDFISNCHTEFQPHLKKIF